MYIYKSVQFLAEQTSLSMLLALVGILIFATSKTIRSVASAMIYFKIGRPIEGFDIYKSLFDTFNLNLAQARQMYCLVVAAASAARRLAPTCFRLISPFP